MGCDIHTITEVKTPEGWKAVLLRDSAFAWRSYGMFGFFADVRNYSDVPPISTLRGWPEDLTQEAKELRDLWDSDAHSFTFLSLAELKNFDYSQPVEDRRVTVQIAPNAWDGGITAKPGGGEMTTYREFLETDFFEEISRLSELGKPEDVRVLMFFDN